jgi:hypothetical protein
MPRSTVFFATVLLASAAALIAGADASTLRLVQAGPRITVLSPDTGPVGAQITIRGANFSVQNNQVEFRGVEKTFRTDPFTGSADGTSLEVRVTPCPAREPQCPAAYVPPGNYIVTVIGPTGVSNPATFSLTRR